MFLYDEFTDMTRFRNLLVLMIAALLAASCSAEIDPVEVQVDGDPVVVDYGEQHELDSIDLSAMVVMFEGRLDADDQFSVGVNQVIDAEVYAGPDEQAGDPHWVTRIQLLDDEGQRLWGRRINSLHQLLEAMNLALREFVPIDVGVGPLFDIVLDDYPELLEFAVKVPSEIDGAHRLVMEVEDREGSGDWRRIADYSFENLSELAEEPDVGIDYEIDALVESGPPRDRINVAILGDGYTATERSEFEGDAQAISDALIGTSPFKEHADLFNIRTIWTPSNESGAGYDCNHGNADDDCVQKFRDTPFETTFVIPALGDQYDFPTDDITDRVAMPLQLAKIYELASLAHYDEIILISNTDKFSGFAGLYIAVVTNYDDRDRFVETAVHEVGHTLGLLGDEYTNPIDPCMDNEPAIPLPANIGRLEGDAVKWDEWFSGDTPIPTPSYLSHRHDVGAFQGAYNCDHLVRPADNCKMNSSREEFCSICAEQMVRRFYAEVPTATSDPATVSVDRDRGVTLSVPVRQQSRHRYTVEWTVDGEPFGSDFDSITLRDDDLSGDDWTTVTATVRNDTEFIRTPDADIESHFQFEVRPSQQ